MDHHDARKLIREGVGSTGGVWADLGAGRGTFTLALGALLGPEGTIYAIDRDAQAVQALRRLELAGGGTLRVQQGDFTSALSLPVLDGILMANALHYATEQQHVLRMITGYLRPGGRLILVEYDRRDGNLWVPYPVPLEAFRELSADAGLTTPQEVGRYRSAYGRAMYAAVARRAGITGEKTEST